MPKKIAFPPIDSDPKYLDARKPFEALKAKAADIRAIVERLEAETTPAEFADAVEAVLAGQDPVAAAAALDNSKALEASRQSLALVQGAITRAQGIVEQERAAAKRRLVDTARPVYREIARSFAMNLLAIAEQQAAFLEFRDGLKAAGLSDWPVSEGPLGMGVLGDVRDEKSAAAQWIIAQIVAGVIEAADVPKSISAGWSLLRGIAEYDPQNPNIATLHRMKRLAHDTGMPSSRLGKRAAG